MESYYEHACELETTDDAAWPRLSRRDACKMFREHGVVDEAEFFAECGDHTTYPARVVLHWLGY